VTDDFKKLLDAFVGDNIADNPQMQGILWRIRCDRMPISYSRFDVELFCRETGREMPSGRSDVQLAAWADTSSIREAYIDWWHSKRADFHAKVAEIVSGYRSDLQVYYYNWDNDKMSLGMNDFTGWDFIGEVIEAGKRGDGAAMQVWYDNIARRKAFTTGDYTKMLRSGDFHAPKMGYLPHHGIRPELYGGIDNFQILGIGNALYQVGDPDYLAYYRTKQGIALSNAVPYDEVNARFINPKYEANENNPGGAPYSVALELLSYFNADARTLTYSAYNYTRGFADAHRRFAQAFRALPAIDGVVVPYGDEDVRIRTYTASNRIYAGVASKAYSEKSIEVKIPVDGDPKDFTVTDLVTGARVKSSKKGRNIVFTVESAPMQLNSFLIEK
jgi:hypothetical protein